MPFELWLAFVAASAVLLVSPGPTILLVVAYALGEGRRAAASTVAGVALGDFTAMTLSVIGLGALLATSAALFTALKWLGAAYLVWLGIRLWRSEPEPAAAARPAARSHRAMLRHAFVVTALNPKSIVFFVAFLPQFMDPAAPVLPQAAVLVPTFVGLAAVNAALYAWAAARARETFRQPAVLKMFNRAGGGMLVGLGILTVAWQRGS